MTSKHTMPPHVTAYIGLMSYMFKQQFRFAQIVGEAALASHPMIAWPPERTAGAAPSSPKTQTRVSAPARHTRAPSAPRPMPELTKHTVSIPV